MANIQPRQIWADPNPTQGPRCIAFDLPSNGLVVLNASTTITLSQDAVYQPICTPIETSMGNANATLPVVELGDPFEASTVPQMFVLGCMMVFAWSLFIILIITPRSAFAINGPGGGHLGAHGIRNNAPGATMVVGVGGRPLLQKFATATVGISLIIAAVNSFKVIRDQYEQGFEDAEAITNQVVASYEMRIIRVVSTTMLWLAQVQTLIRLFPRHREKIIIKWSGFGLIVLDTLFAILNNFVAGGGEGPGTDRPRRFTEAVPALAYLFELALGLLYAAWVIYFSLVKRRFAFFHPKMRNICLVALLSIISISIPVVFFVMDIAQQDLGGWGDYIRLVGAAAASVVVWEWVERIESLEREERKDGILGREIFDGDEMLQTTRSVEVRWPYSRSIHKSYYSRANGWGSGGFGKGESVFSPNFSQSTSAELSARRSDAAHRSRGSRTAIRQNAHSSLGRPIRDHNQVGPSLHPTLSPISRSDTASANSTVYAVVHYPISPSSTPAQQDRVEPVATAVQFAPETISRSQALFQNPSSANGSSSGALPTTTQALTTRLQSIPNPFKRRRRSPPLEVSRSAVDAAGAPSAARWATTRRPKNLFRLRRQQPLLPSELPLVVVPAQSRGRVWSPPADAGDTTHRLGSSNPLSGPTTIPSILRNAANGIADRSNIEAARNVPTQQVNESPPRHPPHPGREESTLHTTNINIQPGQNSSENTTTSERSCSSEQMSSRISTLSPVEEHPSPELGATAHPLHATPDGGDRSPS
ncbi:MAG: hypothetical protein LQ340_006061 [Diploschistes diacapsis]|nr:MAG: hypothetical protein LQ340_006061 [Diploschistes diacapsis]